MVRAFLLVLLAYVTAGVVAVISGILLCNQSPIIVVGAADIAATIVIFLFSVMVRNSIATSSLTQQAFVCHSTRAETSRSLPQSDE